MKKFFLIFVILMLIIPCQAQAKLDFGNLIGSDIGNQRTFAKEDTLHISYTVENMYFGTTDTSRDYKLVIYYKTNPDDKKNFLYETDSFKLNGGETKTRTCDVKLNIPAGDYILILQGKNYYKNIWSDSRENTYNIKIVGSASEIPTTTSTVTPTNNQTYNENDINFNDSVNDKKSPTNEINYLNIGYGFIALLLIGIVGFLIKIKMKKR